MFKVCCFLVFYSMILRTNAAPLDKDSEAKILSNVYTIDEKGNYKFSFKTSNGISREETGSVLNVDQPNQSIFVIGSYSYINTEGKEEVVEYISGENGYIVYPPKPSVVDMGFYGLPASVVATLLGK